MEGIKTCLIAIPCLESMATPFVASLTNMKHVGATKVTFLANSVVYDARNKLAAEAIETGADRILFIDSDMCFRRDLMERLAEDMDSGLDYVCGLFFKRQLPTKPCIYKELSIEDNKPKAIIYEDYSKDELFPIAGSGFGAVMLSSKLLIDVVDAYGAPFMPMAGVFGEDLSFCYRAKELGYELYCDSRIKVGHVGSFIYGEDCYSRK